MGHNPDFFAVLPFCVPCQRDHSYIRTHIDLLTYTSCLAAMDFVGSPFSDAGQSLLIEDAQCECHGGQIWELITAAVLLCRCKRAKLTAVLPETLLASIAKNSFAEQMASHVSVWPLCAAI